MVVDTLHIMVNILCGKVQILSTKYHIQICFSIRTYVLPKSQHISPTFFHKTDWFYPFFLSKSIFHASILDFASYFLHRPGISPKASMFIYWLVVWVSERDICLVIIMFHYGTIWVSMRKTKISVLWTIMSSDGSFHMYMFFTLSSISFSVFQSLARAFWISEWLTFSVKVTRIEISVPFYLMRT